MRETSELSNEDELKKNKEVYDAKTKEVYALQNDKGEVDASKLTKEQTQSIREYIEMNLAMLKTYGASVNFKNATGDIIKATFAPEGIFESRANYWTSVTSAEKPVKDPGGTALEIKQNDPCCIKGCCVCFR